MAHDEIHSTVLSRVIFIRTALLIVLQLAAYNACVPNDPNISLPLLIAFFLSVLLNRYHEVLHMKDAMLFASPYVQSASATIPAMRAPTACV